MRAAQFVIQPTLFDELIEDEKSGFRDPAFASNKNEPVHRWVPWIAAFVDHVLTDYAPRNSENGSHTTVLDPFADGGTTE